MLANSTDDLVEGEQLIDGYPRFIGPDTLEVGGEVIHAGKIIVATGSSPVIPQDRAALGDRVLTSDSQFDPDTCRLPGLAVFFAGDVTGTRMMLQDAAEEGRQAGLNAVAPVETQASSRTFMSIAFTDPNFCQVGACIDELDAPVVVEQRFGPNRRALVMGKKRRHDPRPCRSALRSPAGHRDHRAPCRTSRPSGCLGGADGADRAADAGIAILPPCGRGGPARCAETRWEKLDAEARVAIPAPVRAVG